MGPQPGLNTLLQAEEKMGIPGKGNSMIMGTKRALVDMQREDWLDWNELFQL